jgi:hypothetical protein
MIIELNSTKQNGTIVDSKCSRRHKRAASIDRKSYDVPVGGTVKDAPTSKHGGTSLCVLLPHSIMFFL